MTSSLGIGKNLKSQLHNQSLLTNQPYRLHHSKKTSSIALTLWHCSPMSHPWTSFEPDSVIVQSINQSNFYRANIPVSVARQPNQCSTAKSRKQHVWRSIFFRYTLHGLSNKLKIIDSDIIIYQILLNRVLSLHVQSTT